MTVQASAFVLSTSPNRLTYLEEAEEEISIQRMMIENPCIWYGVELADPSKHAGRDIRRTLFGPQAAQERSRSISMYQQGRATLRRRHTVGLPVVSCKPFTEEEEKPKPDQGKQQHRHKRR